MRRSVPRVQAGYPAAVLVALFLCTISLEASAEPLCAPLEGVAAAMPQPRAAASSAYVDPQTGELTAPPALGGAVLPGPPDSGGQEEIEILPGQTEAGGVMVDLRGHFALGLRASAAGAGHVTTDCEPRNAPATAE